MTKEELNNVSNIDDHLSDIINAKIEDFENSPSMTKIINSHAKFLEENSEYTGIDLYGEDLEKNLKKKKNIKKKEEKLTKLKPQKEISENNFDFFEMELDELKSEIKEKKKKKKKKKKKTKNRRN